MFRFSIRDVLWLTVVVGLGVGWWVDRSALAPKAAKAAELERTANVLANELERYGWKVDRMNWWYLK
jgi:hypothetical protein